MTSAACTSMSSVNSSDLRKCLASSRPYVSSEIIAATRAACAVQAQRSPAAQTVQETYRQERLREESTKEEEEEEEESDSHGCTYCKETTPAQKPRGQEIERVEGTSQTRSSFNDSAASDNMSKPIRQQSSAIAACLRDSPPNSKRDAGEPPRHHSGVAQGKPLCNFTTGRLEHARHQVSRPDDIDLSLRGGYFPQHGHHPHAVQKPPRPVRGSRNEEYSPQSEFSYEEDLIAPNTGGIDDLVHGRDYSNAHNYDFNVSPDDDQLQDEYGASDGFHSQRHQQEWGDTPVMSPWDNVSHHPAIILGNYQSPAARNLEQCFSACTEPYGSLDAPTSEHICRPSDIVLGQSSSWRQLLGGSSAGVAPSGYPVEQQQQQQPGSGVPGGYGICDRNDSHSWSSNKSNTASTVECDQPGSIMETMELLDQLAHQQPREFSGSTCRRSSGSGSSTQLEREQMIQQQLGLPTSSSACPPFDMDATCYLQPSHANPMPPAEDAAYLPNGYPPEGFDPMLLSSYAALMHKSNREEAPPLVTASDRELLLSMIQQQMQPAMSDPPWSRSCAALHPQTAAHLPLEQQLLGPPPVGPPVAQQAGSGAVLDSLIESIRALQMPVSSALQGGQYVSPSHFLSDPTQQSLLPNLLHSSAGMLMPDPPELAGMCSEHTNPSHYSPSASAELRQRASMMMMMMQEQGGSGPAPPYPPGLQAAACGQQQLQQQQQMEGLMHMDAKHHSLYKTELCRSWSETGSCRYGLKCQFAHGAEELRPVQRHPKYKTEICRTFAVTGTCPYGTRCRFIHYTRPSSAGGSAGKEHAGSQQAGLGRSVPPCSKEVGLEMGGALHPVCCLLGPATPPQMVGKSASSAASPGGASLMGGLQARAEAASRQAKKEQQQSSSKRLPIFADILHEDSNDNASSAQWAPNMM